MILSHGHVSHGSGEQQRFGALVCMNPPGYALPQRIEASNPETAGGAKERLGGKNGFGGDPCLPAMAKALAAGKRFGGKKDNIRYTPDQIR